MNEHSKWSTLERAVLLALNKAADTVGEVGEQQLKESIDEVVYNSYDPIHYERTYELRESSTYDKTPINNGTQVEIFNNVQMIYPHDAPSEEKWLPQHQTLSGIDVSSYIPEYVVSGKGGKFNMPPRDYFKDAREKLANGKAKKALQDGLKRLGIDSL